VQHTIEQGLGTNAEFRRGVMTVDTIAACTSRGGSLKFFFAGAPRPIGKLLLPELNRYTRLIALVLRL
jgi:hypothetical protein